MTLKYSETFFSAQGEGQYVGIPSLWMRFFLCNLQCNGFGQKDPTNPETYELPYETIDITNIDSVFDLPVFDKGCDSSYSWSKKFKNLQRSGTAEDIAHTIVDMLKNHDVDFIVNTTEGKQATADSYLIRRTALQNKVCYTTTMAGGRASVAALRHGEDRTVHSLQDLQRR